LTEAIAAGYVSDVDDRVIGLGDFFQAAIVEVLIAFGVTTELFRNEEIGIGVIIKGRPLPRLVVDET